VRQAVQTTTAGGGRTKKNEKIGFFVVYNEGWVGWQQER
jgi:hypothetical protein